MLIREIRWAFRSCRKTPGFVALASGILALGIGANTAVFSIIQATLLRALPYPQPEQLALLWEKHPQLPDRLLPVTQGNYLDWSESGDAIEQSAAFRSRSMVLTGAGDAHRLEGLRASASLLEMIGITPMLGRGFSPEEDRPGGPEAVLLSHGLWQRRFGSDEAIVGRSLRLDGRPHTVVGVLPPEFLFPPPVEMLGNLRQFDPQFLVPLQADPSQRRFHNILMLVRIRQGLDPRQAEARLAATAVRLAQDHPDWNSPGLEAVLAPLHRQATAGSRSTLLLAMAAVGLILLIACVNVANLILARSAARRREIAVRLALGAGRWRVTRQLLLESSFLALAGSAAGVVIATASLKPLASLAGQRVPRLGPIEVDGTVLLFALGAALATTLLFGLFPALQACTGDWGHALRGGREGGHMRQGLRKSLAAVQIALATVLLIGAGLLVRSLFSLQAVDPGFESRNVQAFEIHLDANRYADLRAVNDFVDRGLAEIRSLPQVLNAAAVSRVPLSGADGLGTFDIQGHPSSTGDERRLVGYLFASPEYFQTMEIPLLQGRSFDAGDRADGLAVAIVDQALAERFWPGRSPIGSMISSGLDSQGETLWANVVGVAASVRQEGLEADLRGTIYYPLSQHRLQRLQLAVLSSGDTSQAASAVRQRLRQLDRDLAIEVRTMESYLREASAGRRSPTLLATILATMALILAAAGLYGLMSFLVAQRTREIGIRVALGADRTKVTRLIASEAARLAAIGLAAGLLGAWALSRSLSGVLFGIDHSDPATYAASGIVLAAVSLLAAWLPARKAARLDPLEALRNS